MSIRLMSHNQWKCDHNSPAWETMGLDCSATPRMQGFAKAIDHIFVRGERTFLSNGLNGFRRHITCRCPPIRRWLWMGNCEGSL